MRFLFAINQLHRNKRFLFIFLFFPTLLLISCRPAAQEKGHIDKLNERAYFFHYRNLDSVSLYADSAFHTSTRYTVGKAEALNHKAFVAIARMQYKDAWQQLDSVNTITNNRLELAIADIQRMRLCQRESRNKDFYIYKARAWKHLDALITKEFLSTPPIVEQISHKDTRLAYAWSEYAIVASTYYYYVGQYDKARETLQNINPYLLEDYDVQQMLNFYYSMGSGGMLVNDNPEMRAWMESDYLIQCYIWAREQGIPYFEAQAMQSLSEHLLQWPSIRDRMANMFIGHDALADSQLAFTMAEEALNLFEYYGDVYQVAGAYRTLAQCYWDTQDYVIALENLKRALSQDTRIYQAPDLIASIREQLSIVYSALNEKKKSDENRNIYLDLQQETRQDRQMEARADELREIEQIYNLMLVAIGIVIVMFLAWCLRQQRLNKQQKVTIAELKEEEAVAEERLRSYKRQNLDARAKVSFVGSLIPLIDRMKIEFSQAQKNKATLTEEKKIYISEILSEIERNNAVLNDWIALRKGKLHLHIETFQLNDLFQLLEKGRASFQMRGINFIVKPTSLRVKADKTLTLFMLNTMADNARRYTLSGGLVTISAEEDDKYVEISIKDTGKGISPDQTAGIFDHKVSNNHGFGLMNCKGIIEQYKKTSHLFSVCQIGVESKEGQGSRFFFRLPKGIIRMIIGIIMMFTSFYPTIGYSQQQEESDTTIDSLQQRYHAEIIHYNQTLKFDSALIVATKWLTYENQQHSHTIPLDLHQPIAAMPAAELLWYEQGIQADYPSILDIRNEIAIAALGLHNWELYEYNNRAYTSLFRLMSTDNGLSAHVNRMAVTTLRKNIAIGVLFCLLPIILLSYFLLYYRPKRQYLLFRQQQDGMERAIFEADRLYISNSVIDNCLSALKHETMYFPARIKTLIQQKEPDMDSLEKMVNYYEQLYRLLFNNAQAQSAKTYQHPRIIDIAPQLNYNESLRVVADADILDYMFQILQRYLGDAYQHPQVDTSMKNYIILKYQIDVPLTAPSPQFRRDYMLLRQMLRDMGDISHARACGITEYKINNTKIEINITLVRHE